MEDSGANPSGKGYEGKTGLCSKDSDCSEGQACKGNACTDVCSPNPCSGGYKCIAGGHSYTCVQCTADSDCASNKKCSNNICIDACSGNNCASQSKKCTTNSSHGYTCYGCTSDAACPNDQRCDTRTSACVALCPSACEGNMICTVTGSHKATCSCESDANCPAGQTCDTATKQCVAADCGSWLTANGYGAAKDMETLKTAVASNVTEIGLLENFTITEDINLNGKKLYQANKYSGSAECKALPRVTLNIASSVKAGGGGFEDMTLNLKTEKSSVKFFTDSVGFKNVTMNYTTDNWANLFDVTGGTVNFDGTNTIQANTKSTTLKFTNNSKLNISGSLTLSGTQGIGMYFDASSITVAKTGKLTYRAGANVFDLIELREGTKAIFNGPVDIQPVKANDNDYIYRVFYVLRSSLALNGSGNILNGRGAFGVYIDKSNSQKATFDIKGSTTINVEGSSSNGREVFDIDHGNYYDPKLYVVNIDAPVTVKGLKAYSGQYEASQADYLFRILDATVNINSTVTTDAGITYNLRGILNIGSSGYLNGISKYKMDTSGGVNYKSGAKIKLGGICKKAAKNQSFSGSSQKYYHLEATSANNLGSPFTGGC